MGLREALRRADAAVQDTAEAVRISSVLAAAAVVVAVIALVVAVSGKSS